jgi:hypothetical protein
VSQWHVSLRHRLQTYLVYVKYSGPSKTSQMAHSEGFLPSVPYHATTSAGLDACLSSSLRDASEDAATDFWWTSLPLPMFLLQTFLTSLLRPCFPSLLSPGVLSLANYFRFWGAFYLLFTAGLLFKAESPPPPSRTQSLSAAGLPSPSKARRQTPTRWFTSVISMYRRLWAVGSLSSIQQLAVVLLLCKLGAVTAEAVGVFKLMEKGVTRVSHRPSFLRPVAAQSKTCQTKDGRRSILLGRPAGSLCPKSFLPGLFFLLVD